MFDRQARPQSNYRPESTRLSRRVLPQVWVIAGLGGILLCALTFSAARSIFRDVYGPRPLPSEAAILMPTLPPTVTRTPPAAAVAAPPLPWTGKMEPMTDGSLLPPEDVEKSLQDAWALAESVFAGVPDRGSKLIDQVFTGDALASLKSWQASPPSGAQSYTLAQPARKEFGVQTCTPRGDVCDVFVVYRGITLVTVRASDRRVTGSQKLDSSLIYLYTATFVWDGARWRCALYHLPEIVNVGKGVSPVSQ